MHKSTIQTISNNHEDDIKISQATIYNTIHAFVKKLKKEYDLIYLDEFQVTNIVDAMILGKLFELIFKENIKIIITTNTKLNDLYKE